MNQKTLTNKIKEKAHNLGFSLVGVSTSEQLDSFQHYKAWIAADHHSEMAYLARERQVEKRADPKNILPECQSILVLAIPYSNPGSATKTLEESPSGRVAAYAWGQDYHELLKPRLQEIVAFIEEQAGHKVPNRWYTDTGPILERELAQRAGLGWIAKNSMLINPGMGSYFLLAEILLGIELETDEPITQDYCGSCTRCIDACPTDCILPNRTLDAGRCLSYLSIELKGAVPAEQRKEFKDWVFGCDICQEVCPWNIRFAPDDGEPEFAGPIELRRPELEKDMLLSAELFNQKFKGSPIKRTKRRGYLRNTALALGNAGKASSIPILVQSLKQDPEPLVRAHAAWALGEFQENQARDGLTEAMKSEKDESVILEISEALSNFG